MICPYAFIWWLKFFGHFTDEDKGEMFK